RALHRLSTRAEAVGERRELFRGRAAPPGQFGDGRTAHLGIGRLEPLGQRHAATARAIVSATVPTGPTPRMKFSGSANTAATTASTAAGPAGQPPSARSRRWMPGQLAA